MYHIKSKEEKPDIEYLETRAKQMMKNGVAVGNLVKLYKQFIGEQKEIATDILNNYGVANPNSSKQLVAFISNIDSYDVYEYCFIDGKWTTNKEALGALSLLGHKFATDLLDYRKAKKYAESIKALMNAEDSQGMIHPTVTLAKTNRVNYASPALLNIPKPLLWHVIKPSSEDNILISADIKNQEPSILINILNADKLKGALLAECGLYEHLFTQPFEARAKLNILITNGHKPGFISNTQLSDMSIVPPIYYTPITPPVSSSYYKGIQVRYIDISNIVVEIGGKEPELPSVVTIETVDMKQHELSVTWDSYDKNKLRSAGIIECSGKINGIEIRCEGVGRKEFKVSWNAMTYGASIVGIKKFCKNIDGEAIYKYFNKIEEFNVYRNSCKKLADKGIQEINTYFGTKLSANQPNRNVLRRVLMDLPIQGTAADILSMLVRHIDNELTVNSLVGKLSIYFTRHDEIIFEVNKAWVKEIGIDKVILTIRNMTEHKVDDWIPFKVEIKELKPETLYLNIEDEEELFI